MKIAELVTAIVIALFSVYLMWKSGQGPSWNPDAARFDNIGINIDGEGPGSGFWPFWLAVIMLIASFGVIFNWVKGNTSFSVSDEPFLDGYGWRMLALVGGGLLGFLGLIEYIGFYGAMFVFLMYYLLFLGRHKFAMSLVISAAVPVFCFFFFDVAMRIVLPKGISEPLFLPLYEIFL